MTSEQASNGNILVVDDTLENLKLLSNMLGQEGYEVRPVPDGAMALAAVEAEPPDLILLDITMKPMNGYEVCERLKRDARSRDIPVIFVSALDETIDKVRAFALGGVDYVTKPYQLPEVLARVSAHLKLRRTQQALEQSYERLRQLEAMRDDLVHMVVHDLRSPLTALIYNLSFLREDLVGKVPPEVLRDVEAGEVAALMMVGMANDLLDVSRLESDRLPMKRAPADMVEVVRAAVDNVRRMQAKREVVIEASAPVPGWFDATLIRRVIENLVSNGLKHTPPEHPLRIETAGGDELRVVVRDQGEGVPEPYRTRIFEKFGVGAARQDNAYHSAGMGLAFCKLAVEAHGGRIGVDCSSGVGSAFWFVLPNPSRAE